MHQITKTYHFSAAHMLVGHPKCGRMHGHNYKVDVTVKGELDEHGWVMDFGDLNKIVDPFIDLLDHRFIETEAAEFIGNNNDWVPDPDDLAVLNIQSSTAERLAQWFGREIHEKLPKDISLVSVTVWETEKARATWA